MCFRSTPQSTSSFYFLPWLWLKVFFFVVPSFWNKAQFLVRPAWLTKVLFWKTARVFRCTFSTKILCFLVLHLPSIPSRQSVLFRSFLLFWFKVFFVFLPRSSKQNLICSSFPHAASRKNSASGRSSSTLHVPSKCVFVLQWKSGTQTCTCKLAINT